MPRHRKTYDDDYQEAKGGHHDDVDDGYDVKQNPTSKRAKELKKPKERNEYVEEPHKVPKNLHGSIIGPKGSKLRELEAETACEIDMPRREANSDTIYICGGEADVRRAKKLIDDIVKEAELLNLRRSRAGDLQETSKAQTTFPTLPGEEKCVLQLDVEKFAHGKVIGRNATRLLDLKKRLTKQEHAAFDLKNIEIVIPKEDDVSNVISIHLPAKSMAEKAQKIVKEFFEFYEIKEHLISTKVVDGLSMVGDDSRGKGAKKQQGGGGGGQKHADPQPPAASAGKKNAAAASSGEGSKKAPTASATVTVKNQRKDRAPNGKLADLLVAGYEHPVKPKRRYDA